MPSNLSIDTDAQVRPLPSVAPVGPGIFTLDVMDSAALEELMSQNIPWIEPEDHAWHNVHDGRAPKVAEIAAMLSASVGAGDVFVHILAEPAIYAQVNASEAPKLIGRHVLRGRIHVSNPEFSGFLVVMPNGVATAWKKSEHDV